MTEITTSFDICDRRCDEGDAESVLTKLLQGNQFRQVSRFFPSLSSTLLLYLSLSHALPTPPALSVRFSARPVLLLRQVSKITPFLLLLNKFKERYPCIPKNIAIDGTSLGVHINHLKVSAQAFHTT